MNILYFVYYILYALFANTVNIFIF